MAKQETSVSNSIMIDLSQFGVRLFKNVRGLFKTLDGLRKVLAGLLVPGGSDLIGFTPVKITQEMVGQTIAVFTAIESKTATGSAFKDQRDFIEVVTKNGGYAGVARNPQEARKICKISG